MFKVLVDKFKHNSECYAKIRIIDDNGTEIPNMSYLFVESEYEDNIMKNDIHRSVENITNLLKTLYNSGKDGLDIEFLEKNIKISEQ